MKMNPTLETPINTKDEFTTFKNAFHGKNCLPEIFAIGQPFFDEDNKLYAVRYLTVNVNKNYGFIAAVLHATKAKLNSDDMTVISLSTQEWRTIEATYFMPFAGEKNHHNLMAMFFMQAHRDTKRIIVAYPGREFLQKPVTSVADADFRLALLSNREFEPNTINLEGVFGVLPKRYFTPTGVYTHDMWQEKFLTGNMEQLIAVDKFPPMWWGAMIPKSVRIADPSRVRMGAYLGDNTTVMHEGFVNFNAGTKADAMVEGRISAGATVGKDSDIGGGASIAGTLSGGGKEKITIGKNCLLSANAGTGISLGDRCTIEAGLYITPGMPIAICSPMISSQIKKEFLMELYEGRLYKAGELGPERILGGYFVKALYLSGKDDLLFIRNSVTQHVEVRFNSRPNKLNPVLHNAPAVEEVNDGKK